MRRELRRAVASARRDSRSASSRPTSSRRWRCSASERRTSPRALRRSSASARADSSWPSPEEIVARSSATWASLAVSVSCARSRRLSASDLALSSSASWRSSRWMRSSAAVRVWRAERSSAWATESSCAANCVASRAAETSSSLASIADWMPRAFSLRVVSWSFSDSSEARTARISLSREKTPEPALAAALRGLPA